MQRSKPLGERLIEAGLITPEQRDIALKEQKKTGELIGAILYSLGFISQKDLQTVLSVTRSGNAGKQVEHDLVLPAEIEEIVRQSTATLRKAGETPDKVSDISLAPVVRLIEKVLIIGIQKGATDIHIGPDVKGTRVRYRIDGLLQHGMYLPRDMLPALVSRIKIMGSMNIAESRIPQDGSAEFSWQDKKLDLRISSFPVYGGENIVLRLLDKSQLILGLENLGFLKEDIEFVNESLAMPFGMILVTGPTGSGKTTTLYSALSIINSVYKNIFTIEDPIEYQLPLVRQSQVNVKAGLTFASGLRSILRQDPDIILVGEMRDTETAELAIRSALTGHLVFSTLHTNNAVSSLPRLLDMGIEPFLIASTVDTVLSQRLVRVLCPACKEEYIPPEATLDRLNITKTDQPFFQARGCDQCSNSGYKGRTVLYEIMKMNDEIKRIILVKSGTDDLLESARRTGMNDLLANGLKKVASGITSLEEVLSATRTY